VSDETIAKPLPDVNDRVTAPYWAGTRDAKLLVPSCVHCSYRLWPPEEVCPECLSEQFSWSEITPVGTLWSYAVYHRALDPAFADEVPYAVGLIELAPDVKMYGMIRGDLDALEIGRPATAVFERATAEVTFVRWQIG
jgi:uncharacterized OB-fold protein